MPCGLSGAIIGTFGMSTPLLRLPFIPDTISDGCVCGPVEGGWPGHPRLFQSRSVARIHGVGALHVPVVMPVGVGVAPMFDFNRGPGLSPKMLRRLQSRLSFPGNRERQGQALLRTWWWFHHSAKKKIKDPFFSLSTYWLNNMAVFVYFKHKTETCHVPLSATWSLSKQIKVTKSSTAQIWILFSE